MFPATQEISTTFTMDGIRHSVEENEKVSYVKAGFSGDHFKHVRYCFYSRTDKGDVELVANNYISVPEDAAQRVLEKCNEMNRKYRFAKFVLHGQDVTAEYDFPACLKPDDMGPIARELTQRFNNILDDAYPEFMKAIWTEPEAEDEEKED